VDKIINSRSSAIFYRTEGKGYPVILIHGFAEDGTIWQNQIEYLAKNYQLILPDLPGSGKSSFDPQLITIDDYADCIKFIADEEKISSCIIIGHSMGGYITLAFAEKYPEKLKAFGLFHSTAYADSDEKKIARKKGIEFIEKHGSYEFIKQSVPNLFTEDFKMKYPEIVSELIERYNNFHPRSLVSYYNAMMNRPDRTHILKDLKKTVLFIIGEKDSAVSLEHSLQQSFLPELCYIHILENAAHMGMFEDKNHSNEFLNEFLKQAKK
jgi:pimeloyl-ACP methyl ester carboxylesterase